MSSNEHEMNCGCAALAQVHGGRFKVQTEFDKDSIDLPFPFVAASKVIVFLQNVPMLVLEAEGLDVVGDVSNASVEFLRSRSQRAVIIPAGGKTPDCVIFNASLWLPARSNLQFRTNKLLQKAGRARRIKPEWSCIKVKQNVTIMSGKIGPLSYKVLYNLSQMTLVLKKMHHINKTRWNVAAGWYNLTDHGWVSNQSLEKTTNRTLPLLTYIPSHGRGWCVAHAAFDASKAVS